jgi:hypothetical protein
MKQAHSQNQGLFPELVFVVSPAVHGAVIAALVSADSSRTKDKTE